MSLANAWATAQQPNFVSGPTPQHTAPRDKAREAQDLAEQVRAHIAAGRKSCSAAIKRERSSVRCTRKPRGVTSARR